MAKRRSAGPTGAELEILTILWTSGPSTVRNVHRALDEIRPTGYTTALKHLQNMHDKGLVTKDESRRPQVYRARLTRGRAQRGLVGDLLDRLFAGSPRRMVMQALTAKPTTPEDLAEIRKLLDDLEGRMK